MLGTSFLTSIVRLSFGSLRFGLGFPSFRFEAPGLGSLATSFSFLTPHLRLLSHHRGIALLHGGRVLHDIRRFWRPCRYKSRLELRSVQRQNGACIDLKFLYG